MKYFRVDKEHDNKNIYYNGQYILTVFGDELFTEREVKKNHIPLRLIEQVEISKKNIRWFFGVRKECTD